MMINNPFENRRLLEEKIKELDSKISACQANVKNANQAVVKYQTQLKQVKLDLKNLNEPKPVSVSDHALVRYMQRYMHLDFDAIRKQLATKELQDMVNVLGGTGKFPIGHGRVVVKDYTIITYVSNNETDNEES